MSAYTPTTEDVRSAFVEANWVFPHGWSHAEREPEIEARFTAWLAAHDAQVWDEGYRSGEGNAAASFRAGARIVTDNPYRAEAR